MKKITLLLCLSFSVTVFCQNSTTFKIEKLSKPDELLREYNTDDIFKFLNYELEKKSELPKNLVFYGEHSFLTGILTAYKEHRPFVISPDIIWLLINQGFARHITNNAEEFRKDIVNFEKKKDLTIITTDIKLGDKNSNWEALFPQFSNQIAHYTGKELTEALTANFSTTTQHTQIASQITIMEAVKEYFNYKVIMIGCGIPQITIEGTIQDWENILAKTKFISKYKLEWWTSEIAPIIEQIINAKKGNFDKVFWMNMVKLHTEKTYGSPTKIDGWIVKFFPYTKEGKKTSLKPIADIQDLASEIVKVPFLLIDEANNKTYQMEFLAGFVGLSQNEKDYTLKPEIGWAINHKAKFNPEKSIFKRDKKMEDLSYYNVSTIPPDIYSIETINFLHISFLKTIVIPKELSKIKIGTLELDGQISVEHEAEIKYLFPQTKIIINGIQK